MTVRNRTRVPDCSDCESETGPVMRWLCGLLAGFTVLGIALTHFSQLLFR